MFHCDSRFQQYTQAIRHAWEWRFNKTIGNWGDLRWWGAVVGFFLLFATLPIMAVSDRFPPFPYLRDVYCPRVGDCIPFLRRDWPLPIWAWFHLLLALVAILSAFVTQWGYRRKHWCPAWWAYLVYIFSSLFIFATMAEFGLFVGLSGSPIPTALVGYGIPVIYTFWFLGAWLPSMRRLWRGERPDFRPPPLQLQAGAGSAVALLGILGVALGNLLGEMPHGNWGYFAVGIIGVPWMMYLSIRGGMQSLLTLAPWRIVQEAEAAKKALSEEFEEEEL